MLFRSQPVALSLPGRPLLKRFPPSLSLPLPLTSGEVPIPESLLPSALPPLEPLSAHPTAQELLAAVSPADLAQLQRACSGSPECVQDTVATGSPALGQRSLDAQRRYRNLTALFGKQGCPGRPLLLLLLLSLLWWCVFGCALLQNVLG